MITKKIVIAIALSVVMLFILISCEDETLPPFTPKNQDMRHFEHVEFEVSNIPCEYRRTYSKHSPSEGFTSICDTNKYYLLNKISKTNIIIGRADPDLIGYYYDLASGLIHTSILLYRFNGTNVGNTFSLNISFDIYTGMQEGGRSEYYNIAVGLLNLDFNQMSNKAFTAEFSGADLNNRLTDFYFSEDLSLFTGDKSEDNYYTIIKLLPLRDDSKIRIKLY